MSNKSSLRRGQAAEPIRFAHPFFTPVPSDTRLANPASGRRMVDHIEQTLGPVPATTRGGKFSLAQVIGKSGSAAIAQSGQITIHLAGDTGVPEMDRETRQTMVAEVMARDYLLKHPELSPAFFLHLGDVIYGASSDAYLTQFYRPYMHYPGKIIAIPGNHDGESAAKLAAFQANFCATRQVIPKIAGSIFRQTMTQPGVYWCLDAPFVQIIGLYSNNAENPGFLSGGVGGPAQKVWLIKTLRNIKKERLTDRRKALFFATHHPPYSSGGHSGSTVMLADIDDACNQAGIMPDAFFSGHAHSIQRYARKVPFGGKTLTIPYIVSGCGGHGGQVVSNVLGTAAGNPTYEFAYKGWGYTTAVVTEDKFSITSYGVAEDAGKPVDHIQVPLV